MSVEIDRAPDARALVAPSPRLLAGSNDFSRSEHAKTTKVVTTNRASRPLSLHIGALLVTAWLLTALLAPLLALYPPDSQDHGAPADIGTRPQRRASR